MLKLAFFSPVLRQHTCVEIANLMILVMGLSTSWGSPMLVKLRDVEQSPLSRPISENEGAWLISIIPLVGLTVSFYNGYLQDNIGRKTTMLLSFIPRAISCLLVIFGTEYWVILLGRGFSAIADMVAVLAVATYSSEVADKNFRGESGTMLPINSATGMLIMLGVGPFVSYMAINLVMICLAAVVFFPVLLLPESPFFLYTKGKKNEAIEVLTFLRGSEEAAHQEHEQYSNKNTDEDINKWALLKDKVVIKSFIIVIILTAGQQLAGYNAVNMYLQTIFETANTTLSSEISSLIIGIIQLLACSCTFFLTNRFNRKTILCTTIIAKLIGMVGLGSFFTVMENGNEITGFLNYIPLISAAIVIYGFNAGLGSLLWMLRAELLYGPIRAQGMSLGMFVTALSVFAVTLSFPALTSSIGASGTYWIFASFCALLCAYIAIFVPETKDKTFAEIQTALGRKEFVDNKADLGRNEKDLGNEKV